MYNPYLVIPFVSWVTAQLIKFLVSAFKGKLRFQLFYVSGGMPSAHAAVVVSLATVALLLNGAASPLFGVTAILALIVNYDALGVRRMAGEQAAAFNRLLKVLGESRLGLPAAPALRELKGHTPLEVLAGSALGAGMAALFNIDKLATQLEFLSATPTTPEIIGFGLGFGLLVLTGFMVKITLKRRHRGSAAAAKIAEAVMIKTQAIGWPGLLLTFAAYQKASFLAWRAWLLLLIIAMLVWDSVLVKKYRRSLPRALAAEADTARKQHWLNQTARKKK